MSCLDILTCKTSKKVVLHVPFNSKHMPMVEHIRTSIRRRRENEHIEPHGHIAKLVRLDVL